MFGRKRWMVGDSQKMREHHKMAEDRFHKMMKLR